MYVTVNVTSIMAPLYSYILFAVPCYAMEFISGTWRGFFIGFSVPLSGIHRVFLSRKWNDTVLLAKESTYLNVRSIRAQTKSHHPVKQPAPPPTTKKKCQNNENKNTSVRAIFMSFSRNNFFFFFFSPRRRGWRGAGEGRKIKRKVEEKATRNNINTYFLRIYRRGSYICIRSLWLDFHHFYLSFVVCGLSASSLPSTLWCDGDGVAIFAYRLRLNCIIHNSEIYIDCCWHMCSLGKLARAPTYDARHATPRTTGISLYARTHRWPHFGCGSFCIRNPVSKTNNNGVFNLIGGERLLWKCRVFFFTERKRFEKIVFDKQSNRYSSVSGDVMNRPLCRCSIFAWFDHDRYADEKKSEFLLRIDFQRNENIFVWFWGRGKEWFDCCCRHILTETVD